MLAIHIHRMNVLLYINYSIVSRYRGLLYHAIAVYCITLSHILTCSRERINYENNKNA